MSAGPRQASARISEDFVAGAIVETVVPSASSIDLEELLRSWDGAEDEQNPSILPFIQQRQFLLLDELVTAYVVLRTPIQDERSIRSYVSRLDVTLEAHAVGTPVPHGTDGRDAQQSPPPAPQQAREAIFSKIVSGSQEPSLVLSVPKPAKGSSTTVHAYVFWPIEVFVGRPRSRLQRLAIFFSVAASLKPPEPVKHETPDDEYLPSLTPEPANLLDAFAHDPTYADQAPYLSSARLATLAPPTPTAKELMRPIKTGHRRLYRAAPAILWRLRFSKVSHSLREPALIASLDFEITPFAGCDVTLEETSLWVTEGDVTAFGEETGVKTPMTCRPGDQVSFLYRLSPSRLRASTSQQNPLVHSVHIKAIGKVHSSSVCVPRVVIEWRTNVDFAPTPNAAGHQPLAGVGGRSSSPLEAATKTPIMGTQSATEKSEEHMTNPITLSISGPEVIRVGETFRWTIFVTNHSTSTRKLAVIPIPKRTRPVSSGPRPRPSTVSVATKDGEPDWKDQYRLDRAHEPPRAPDLLVLSTDARVGPLAPGACAVAELEFYPMQPGVLQIDALRVVDLSTHEVTDIRDLPDMVVKFGKKTTEDGIDL